MSADNSSLPDCGRDSAILMPNRYKDHPVAVKRDLPGIVILVHGVNDVGVSFPAMDSGLCAGLNERLDRPDLFPYDFRLPKEGDKVQPDPDAIYYQRLKNDKTYSPVIHFHWGYKAAKDDVKKQKLNGQYVDLWGNRLDARLAKCGGMFCNATSNIPDMFKGQFMGGFSVWASNKAADSAHIIAQAPERHYMVLAAKRLTALVTQIRTLNPDDTITLLAHSQGCLISLTAQAFLHGDGQRCVDSLIMCNPPYGVHEPWLERKTQAGDEQQTTQARVDTLVNLVKLITDHPHSTPPLEDLANNAKSFGRAGLCWTPTQGQRLGSESANSDEDTDSSGHDNLAGPTGTLSFNERDNRGKVYLYFCPHDMTVGLISVAGIGTLGVPDVVDASEHGGQPKPISVLSRLPAGYLAREPHSPNHGSAEGQARFLQRVWTWNSDHNQPILVGAQPGPYTLGKNPYPVNWFRRKVVLTDPKLEELRQINGEALNPPLKPELHAGEVGQEKSNQHYQGQQHPDPIDACDVVVKEGPRKNETPDQARQRFQDQALIPNSYHSAIATNQEHHRWVTAMDVALGQAETLHDPDWRDLLMAIADWRTKFSPDKITNFKKYGELLPEVKQLVEANYNYYTFGDFPSALVPTETPSPIVSETRGARAAAPALTQKVGG